MKDNEKEQFASKKNFFCGLHYLIQLGADVNTTIQAWEKMIFGEDKVGAEAVCAVHAERGCGTVRLVWTVCKFVQDCGYDEKSGKPLLFQTFLKAKGRSSMFPLLLLRGTGSTSSSTTAQGFLFCFLNWRKQTRQSPVQGTACRPMLKQISRSCACSRLDRQVGDRSIVACYQQGWSRCWHEWALCSHAGVL